jgi:acyl-[acyl-carrier-protein]-phospholipid O-acyltransferase/long-chain-fatty-acid--[acyl-carrier-protein] ligase
LWIPSPNSFIQVESIPLLGTGKVDLQNVQRLARCKFGNAGAGDK